MMVEVLLEGGFELGHTLEDTAADAIGSDAAEEALDLVEARRRCRGEVHVETWTKCGFSPCAFQIRCTLVWLMPSALASVWALQCVAAGALSGKVVLGARSV